MGIPLKITAADAFQLGAYRADPAGKSKGGVVVVQEIFGVNHHIRSVCDRLSEEGYTALAPAFFDRMVPNFETGYTPEDIAKAREYLPKLDWAAVMRDAAAGVEALRKEGPVAVMGFCFGGTVAFLAAAQIDGLSAAICYYGGMIVKHADKKPKCPTQMHFGEKDDHIPMSDVEIIKSKRPDCEIFTYPAGHGFHCDERGSYHAESAKIAWGRSLAFLSRHMG